MPLDFAEFQEWYDTKWRSWDTARENARKSLSSYLDAHTLGPERSRLHIESGRVKGRSRLWAKVQDKYGDSISEFTDIAEHVDDIVGLRLICTNVSDAERAKDLVLNLREWDASDQHAVLCVEPGSTRDYWSDPKPSGYRSYHVNLVTSVIVGTTREAIRCELQIRTLLQHGWGELTHEDTYKPGSRVPPIVNLLSLRMAELLATLDVMAEDLRQELIDAAEESVEEVLSDEPTTACSQTTPSAAFQESEVRDYVYEYWASLDQPLPLATLAWELKREFDSAISEGWLGYGTFKNMLSAIAPDLTVSKGPPSYVGPKGSKLPEGDGVLHQTLGDDLPAVPRALKNIDTDFPVLSRESWIACFGFSSRATFAVPTVNEADIRLVNQLSRTARDLAAHDDVAIARNAFGYVFKALFFSGKLRPNPMTHLEIQSGLRNAVFERADSLGLEFSEGEKEEFLELLGIH